MRWQSWADTHYKRRLKWHSKFAWWPVEFDDGVVVWLEFIERKRSPNLSWQYRTTDKAHKASEYLPLF